MRYGAVVLVSLICLVGIAAGPASPQDSQVSTARIQAEGRGAPWLNLRDGADLPVEYVRGSRTPAGAQPTALVADDFNSDGMPDLVTGYTEGEAGVLVLQRGNPASIFPYRSVGDPPPFFASTVVVETPGAPDFLVAGDFDNDGIPDIVTASLRGTSLFLHSGDGAGGLKPARRMNLSAEVTLLTAGDINRVDRLFELVVGTDSPDGPQLLAFESPKGAWNADPEVFDLPAPATAATLGDHDRDTRADIAVVAGSELVMIRGRDRKLAEGEKRIASVAPARIETATLPFDANSIAFGDFTGRRIGELAVLSYGGTLELIESTTAKPIVTVETDVRGGKLLAANATTANGDDLIIVERYARQLHVLASAPQSTFARSEMRATLTVDAEPVDVLSMRLNPDALGDLVVLRDATGPAVAVAPSSPTSVYTVTNTNDSGAGSLRRAINDANFYSGADAIHFNIPGAGAHSIHALSDLPAITDPVTIDGTTQPGYAGTPLIEIHGTVGESGRDGLTITAGNSTVRGLAINRFSSDGIRLRDAGNNRIEGNYIGTDLAGGTVLANDDGIDSYGSGHNTIGGQVAGQGNLISGNDGFGAFFGDGFNTLSSTDTPKAIPDSGIVTSTISWTEATFIEDLGVRVYITHPNVSDLEIYLIAPDTTRVTLSTGNGGDGDDYLGTEFDDEASLAITDERAPFFRVYRPETPLSVLDGLSITGTWTLEVRDTVASNTGTLDDWDVIYRYDSASDNIVEGNRIGTNASGTVSLPNRTGVGWYGGPNYVGAPVAGAGNLISGNTSDGIYMSGAGSVVQGNLIGTNAIGTSVISFGLDAIRIDGNGHQIGGAAVFAGNVIALNLGCGVYINGGAGNLVQGNLVGTDASGTAGLGGSGKGICIRGGAANTIGGTTSETRNVISDLDEGIRFTEFPWGAPVPFLPRGNVVMGNYIGTDIDGRGTLGHQTYGIVFEDGHENSIEDGNVICANGFDGVLIHREAFGNLIARNKIGIDVGGAPDPGNGGSGILIAGRYNVIEENVISGNQGHGIMMGNADTATLVAIASTYLPLGIPDPGGVGVSMGFAEDAMVIDVDLQVDVDHTWDSDLSIELYAPDGTWVRLTSNNGGDGDGYDGTIFDDEATLPITEGTAPFSGSYRPEQPLAAFDGMPAEGWWNVWVNDEVVGDAGTFRDVSLILTTVATQGNQIHSNTIGLDEAHDEAVPNAGGGIHVGGAGNHIVNNTIAGNLGPGVTLFGETAVGNVVAGNAIGIESPGTSLILGNRGDGVILDTNAGGAPVGNKIGVEGGGNAINYNAGAGVRVVAGSSNSIRENMIGSNEALGIDLGSPGVNENDPFDFDSGANGLQNFPVITWVGVGPWETVVEGFLESTPGRNFIIELHVWQPDPSGYGEGDWLASQIVTTSPTGEAPFVFVVPGTMAFVTATATGQDGNTSEFSGAMTNVGAASEAGDMRAARLPGDEVEVVFFPACGATNHAIYRGVSPILGSLYFNDVACFVGTEGYATFDPGDPPPGEFFYFVVVGQNYAHEGSYGQDSYGAERPEAAGFGECDRSQVIAMACP